MVVTPYGFDPHHRHQTEHLFWQVLFLLWLNAGTISGWLEAAGVSPERQSRLRRILLEPAGD